jgi:hypothetical protein
MFHVSYLALPLGVSCQSWSMLLSYTWVTLHGSTRYSSSPMFAAWISLDQDLITNVICVGGLHCNLMVVVLEYHLLLSSFDVLPICFKIDVKEVVLAKH